MNIQELSDGCCRSAGRLLFREHALKYCNDSWSSARANASMAAIDDPSERPAIVPAAVLAQLSKRHAPSEAAHRQMRADARSAEGHRFESPLLHQVVAANRPGFPAPTIPRLFSALARKLMVCGVYSAGTALRCQPVGSRRRNADIARKGLNRGIGSYLLLCSPLGLMKRAVTATNCGFYTFVAREIAMA
jgi:hypothetical protein